MKIKEHMKMYEVQWKQCLKEASESSNINNISLYLKKLEKEQTRPKISRNEEIIKIRVEIHEIDNREIIWKNSWNLELALCKDIF